MIAQIAVMQNFCFELKSSDARNCNFAVQQLEICTVKSPVGTLLSTCSNYSVRARANAKLLFISMRHLYEDLMLTKKGGVTRFKTFSASILSSNF